MANGSSGPSSELWRWLAITAISLIVGWGGGQLSSIGTQAEISAEVRELRTAIANLEKARERIERQQALDTRELSRLSDEQLQVMRETVHRLARLEDKL